MTGSLHTYIDNDEGYTARFITTSAAMQDPSMFATWFPSGEYHFPKQLFSNEPYSNPWFDSERLAWLSLRSKELSMFHSLTSFAKELLTKSQPLDTEIGEVINKRFWDMVL